MEKAVDARLGSSFLICPKLAAFYISVSTVQEVFELVPV
jgi:hypothetical protein